MGRGQLLEIVGISPTSQGDVPIPTPQTRCADLS